MKDTEVWYRKYGFAENPFSIKPGIYSENVYGYPAVINEVAKGIMEGKILFVKGNYGNGKSTMLKYILRKFGGKGKLAYFSCNRVEDRLDVKRILNGRYGFLGKFLDLRPKHMILLLDEAQYLNKEDFNSIMHYYDTGNLKSVLFVAKEQINNSMPERMQRIVSTHVLDSVSPSDAVAIVRKRIGNIQLISDDVIKMAFQKSGYNVRVLLKNCEMLCRYASGKGLNSVTADMVELLPSSVKEEKREAPEVPKHFEPLVRAIRQEPKPVQKEEPEIDDALDAKPVSTVAEKPVEKPKAQPVEEPIEEPKDPLSEGLFDEEHIGNNKDSEDMRRSAEELYY